MTATVTATAAGVHCAPAVMEIRRTARICAISDALTSLRLKSAMARSMRASMSVWLGVAAAAEAEAEVAQEEEEDPAAGRGAELEAAAAAAAAAEVSESAIVSARSCLNSNSRAYSRSEARRNSAKEAGERKQTTAAVRDRPWVQIQATARMHASFVFALTVVHGVSWNLW